MHYKRIIKNIRCALKEYIQKHRLRCLVIGVSGGIDSAVCCALARPVCDELDIPLIGRSITIESNEEDEINRARAVGKAFCRTFEEVDFTELYISTVETFGGTVSLDKIARGNIKARMRMQLLYAIAGMHKGIVLSTDNLTEYFLGFWTIAGDIGDYGMIQQLWKMEVYHLADYSAFELKDDQFAHRALTSCKLAVPTDGLGISKSDLDQIGADSYDETDRILKTWLTKDIDAFHWDIWLEYPDRLKDYNEFVMYRDSLKDHLVVQRHERTHFKRNWPVNIGRRKLFK